MQPPLLPLALLALLPAVPRAQDLHWTDGALGSEIRYHIAGATPGKIWMIGVSNNQGPTPIALLDPSDPRVLSLGIEFLKLWATGVIDPNGAAQHAYPLPASPSAVGLKIHAQFLTLFGATTLVDQISNGVATRMQLPGTSVGTIGERSAATIGHSQTPLPDGRVLLLGGADPAGATDAPLGVLELFDPQTQAFTAPPAVESRVDHTATALADGRVLLAGGRGAAGTLALAQIYDPATGALTDVAPLPAPRSQHDATLLADGRVLVTGGLASDDPADPIASYLTAHRGTLLYDPTADAWSPGPLFSKGLIGHRAAQLADGRVLIAGGVELGSLFGFPTQGWSARCWLLDPTAGSLAPAAAMPAGVARHALLVPSADPRPLVIGGERVEPFFLKTYTAAVLRYDPALDVWTELAPLNAARGFHAAVEADGHVVVAGGISAFDPSLLVETPEATFEIAPLDVSAWSAPAALVAPRSRARATAIDGGQRVLVTGGLIDAAPAPAAELVMP